MLYHQFEDFHQFGVMSGWYISIKYRPILVMCFPVSTLSWILCKQIKKSSCVCVSMLQSKHNFVSSVTYCLSLDKHRWPRNIFPKTVTRHELYLREMGDVEIRITHIMYIVLVDFYFLLHFNWLLSHFDVLITYCR